MIGKDATVCKQDISFVRLFFFAFPVPFQPWHSNLQPAFSRMHTAYSLTVFKLCRLIPFRLESIRETSTQIPVHAA
jgi:hypothetical protein